MKTVKMFRSQDRRYFNVSLQTGSPRGGWNAAECTVGSFINLTGIYEVFFILNQYICRELREGPTPVSALIHAATMVKCCRWLTWVNQLWYRYVLGLPYIKFIYILSFLNKINKKILCFIVEKKLFIIKGVNQQETLLSNLLGFPTHPRPPTPAPLSLLLERGAGYASVPFLKGKGCIPPTLFFIKKVRRDACGGLDIRGRG